MYRCQKEFCVYNTSFCFPYYENGTSDCSGIVISLLHNKFTIRHA